MRKNFAVLGLGRFGKSIALELDQMGFDVLAVDKDEAIAASMVDYLTHVVSFDMRDSRAMEQAGIAEMDTIIITSKNLEASLMATMLCKKLSVKEIVVKAIDERHAEMAKSLGATKMVFSERDMARNVAMSLVSPNAINYVDIDVNINILSLDVPEKIIGKNLIQANLRADYNVNIIAIVCNGETIVTPPPTRIFTKDDKIFVIGTPAALVNFENSTKD